MKTTALFKKPVSDWYSTQLRWHHFDKEVAVDYGLLQPTQDDLDDDVLLDKLTDTSKHGDVLVVCVDARYILINGHHTAASLVLAGQREIKVKLCTLNKYKSKIKNI